MYVCVSWSHFCCLFFFLLLPEKQFESLQSKSCHSKFMAKLKQISTTEVTRSFHMLYSKHPHKSAYENIFKKWVITYFCLFTYCFFIIILEYYSLLWGSFCSILTAKYHFWSVSDFSYLNHVYMRQKKLLQISCQQLASVLHKALSKWCNECDLWHNK